MGMIPKESRRRAGSVRERLSGQGLVEAALVIPILVTLLLLTVNGAMVFRAQMSAEQACAEGARYAALHPSASEAEIVQWTLESTGLGSGSEVTVETSEVASQPYTMRVVDNDGTTRSAGAVNRRYAHVVTARVPVSLVGMGQTFVAASSHGAISSEEGVI